jgi:threonine/homoserine/homoserine lactone efflux protein
LGAGLFLAVKPYKKKWLNHADGLFLVALGALMITRDSGAKLSFIVGTVIVTLVTASVLLYYIYTCATKCKKQ